MRPILKKTPYEFSKGSKPNTQHFHPFGFPCFIHNTKDNLGKFDFKADKCIFLGYSHNYKAYRVHSSRTLVVEESIHVKFDKMTTSDDLPTL